MAGAEDFSHQGHFSNVFCGHIISIFLLSKNNVGNKIMRNEAVGFSQTLGTHPVPGFKASEDIKMIMYYKTTHSYQLCIGLDLSRKFCRCLSSK